MPIDLFSQAGRTDYIEQVKHSVVEVTATLACAILLIVLVALFLFVGAQGGRYFLPMSTFQVTTYPVADTTTVLESDTQASLLDSVEPIIEYMLSHESSEDLATRFKEKISSQYINTPENAPRVVVNDADSLFLLNTRNGRQYVGEFVSIYANGKHFTALDKLDEITATVDTLAINLKDIQITKLQVLHREIADYERKGVQQDTLAFERKISEFSRWQDYANVINEQINNHTVSLKLDTQKLVSVPIIDIQSLYQPNQLSIWQSVAYTTNKLFLFLSESPKQASTSGGVFPAIFGTLLMVIIMAVIVMPFGAIAAIYLHEYAPDNRVTAIIRISVSNMAAVPSVVYGVFGLGFFVYGLGGSIDSLIYREQLPSPTFGTPGLLWAALTMGILTLPVVIVSTEEGLSRVPENLRTGALALGATKFETIRRVVLPMASPGILTGIILAIARAAGEVAPLILVGAVKFAPTLPIDGEFPFVHLERQFMHLGVFVYDGAFHNQTESQVSSLMFATCMLLLIIVFLLNISAILLRSKLRNRYKRL